MHKTLVVTLLLLVGLGGCAMDEAGVDEGSSMVVGADACTGVVAAPDAAPAPPDAAVPLCPHHTKGVMIGDSITVGVYKYRTPITSKGHIVLNNAVAGHEIGNQYAVWLTSPYRGDASIDWIFIQVGINDILHDITTVPQYTALMRVFLADIRASNPHAVIFFGKVTPAKSRFDEITAVAGHNRYQMWLDTNSAYASFTTVLPGIAAALNDGADSLLPQYANTDHLHLNIDGYTLSSTILESWIEAAFPPVPCN